MKVYFLISGLLRTFIKTLYPFLSMLEKHIECEFIICTSRDDTDTNYTGISINDQLDKIIKNTKYNFILESEKINFPNNLSQREKNTIYQWFHLEKVFNYMKDKVIDDNNIIVRIRPDINILSSIEQFITIIKKAYNSSSILIPIGSDLFSEIYRPYVKNSINDQLAIGKYKFMKDYCRVYSDLDLNLLSSPIISEKILYEYLDKKHINISRVELDYNICLSECKLIAIAGDSGVGKTTLLNALQNIFPYDSSLILETDRYHKWNRNDENWNTYTHLNPNANYLEYMINDTYKLKMGDDIEQVNYDHSTGKFTKPEIIQSKPYILLCGLHTLYKSELRTTSDIKIFIDVQVNLKRYWKLQRDIKYRGYSLEKAVEVYKNRLNDYTEYILPQKEHADIIISYSTPNVLPEDNINIIPIIECKLICKNKYTENVNNFLDKMSTKHTKYSDKSIFYLKNNLSIDNIISFIPYNYNKYLSNIESSYLGIIQVLFILLLFKPEV